MAILHIHSKEGMNSGELREKLKEKSSFWKLNQMWNALDGSKEEFEPGYDTTIIDRNPGLEEKIQGVE